MSKTLIVLCGLMVTAAARGAEGPSPTLPRGWCSIFEFGAAGDGNTDDTDALQQALDSVAESGGTVILPSCPPGQGYVIKRTVRVPTGVTLMGSASGFATDGTAAYPLPEQTITGVKIFARPQRDQYDGRQKRPLFDVERGATVRGLYILYDEQPWPSDEDFQDSASPYYYPDFETARRRFYADHVRRYGPTFYMNYAVNNVIEDVACARYYDFVVLPYSGKTFINRIFCYGYGRSFAYGEALDINRLSHIHNVPNAGPASPGRSLGKHYSWIYGIIASNPDSVGVHIGRSDGYTYDDVFFFGVHTALRLGASREFPFREPVSGERWFADLKTRDNTGFQHDYTGQGPWGDATNVKADQCTVGVHLVWPSHQLNRFANLLIFTSTEDGKKFKATGGTGNLESVGQQAAFLIEPSFSTANNKGFVGSVMATNTQVASFNDSPRFGPAAANAQDANGRLFLINGDVSMAFANFNANFPYVPDRLFAVGEEAEDATVRIRNMSYNGQPAADLFIRDKTSGILGPGGEILESVTTD